MLSLGLQVEVMLAHLDRDNDGALSLEEFSLGVRSYPTLVDLFVRYDAYQDSEMVRIESLKLLTPTKPSRGGKEDPEVRPHAHQEDDAGCGGCATCIIS